MQFGSYTTEKIIEQHGAATVYAANSADGQSVLITAITPTSEESARKLHARFFLVGKLQHPAILRLMSNSQTDDSTFYTAVRRLSTVIPPKGTLSMDDALNLSARASAALDYAHSQNVVHGFLRRTHIVRSLTGEIFVRGFEIAGEQAGLSPDRDIADLARLVYRALAGTEPGSRTSRTLPRPITAVLRQAVIGEYPTAGAFHEALEAAAKRKAPLADSKPRKQRSTCLSNVIVLLLLLTLAAIITILVISRQIVDRPALPLATVAMIPSDTATATASNTATATSTSTSTATSTSTSTPTHTTTNTPTATHTSTNTSTATFTPINTPTATPVPDGVVLPQRGLVLRTGPAEFYFTAGSARFGTFVSIVARTATKNWIKVKVGKKTGWASAKSFKIYVDLDTVPVIPADQLALIPVTRPCVTVTGDSVAHGGAIFEIPDGSGYVRTQMASLSAFIEQAFVANGAPDIQGIDRSLSSTGISSPNHDSYLSTPAYDSFMMDRCKYTVIMPWINDLTSNLDASTAAQNHAGALLQIIDQLIQRNPYGRILLLNYYSGAPTVWSLSGFASGYTTERLIAFNNAISAICASNLAAMPQVTCVPVDTLFAPMGTNYVVGAMSRAQIEADLISGINDTEVGWMNTYLASHPNGQFIGDGVHLSTGGKSALATHLVLIMRSLPNLTPNFD